jgi:hypothetical protein
MTSLDFMTGQKILPKPEEFFPSHFLEALLSYIHLQNII